jgi:hypothetical protein
MKILTSLFGGGSAQAMTANINASGVNLALPYSATLDLLWAYYLSNGVYDELRLAGYFLDDDALKGLRNPAGRVVKFYVDTIWPGRLPDALPLDTANDQIKEPIQDLWKWSNWQNRKQLLVRLTAVLGEIYIKVAQPLDKPDRIYLQLIRPEYVADDNVTFDEQGNITYIRVDIPRSERKPNGDLDWYIHTEVWDKALGTARTWKQKKGITTAVSRLGTPDVEYNLKKEWDIDFIPFVRAVHADIGEDRGVGAYLLQLDKIDEANRLATNLHAKLFRHNSPTWALRSNMVDAATGRPLPPPRVSTTTNADGDEVVDLSGEKFIRLPGNASLEPLIPNINYADALAILNAHMAELENDLPELRYFRLQEAPDLSGRAIRLMMKPAVASALEVRGNLEDALVRAQKMALTIGQNVGIWSDLGNYDSGDLEHGFHERPVLDGGRIEEAETWQAETSAGLPLITVLKRSGWNDADIEDLTADFADTQAMQQGSMASSLLEAMSRFDAGQNGQVNAPPNVPPTAVVTPSANGNDDADN